jgi:hypothetical protein
MRSHSTSAVRAASPLLRRGVAAGSVIGIIALCTGCGGYDHADMNRDSGQFVPIGAAVEGADSSFDKNGGYPDDVVGGWIRILMPGTRQQRLQAIRETAIAHGWQCRQTYCTKAHVDADITVGVALPGSKQHIYDEITIDASYYDPTPLLD